MTRARQRRQRIWSASAGQCSRRWRVVATCAGALSVAGIQRSDACGGVDITGYPVLSPPTSTASALLSPDYWAGFGQVDPPELRFLYPAMTTHPQELADLWQAAYLEPFRPHRDAPARSFPSTIRPLDDLHAQMDRHLAAGDLAAAVRSARALIEAWLGQPPTPVSTWSGPFWSAADLMELAPHLAQASLTHLQEFFLRPGSQLSPGAPLVLRCARQPGMPSCPPPGPVQQAKALFVDTHRKIPNGWGTQVQQVLQASGNGQVLLQRVDAWLQRYPRHPLADWMRLWKVRLLYFTGQDDANWRLLLDLYPRRKVRALAEMRYLLLQGRAPSAAVLGAIRIPEVAAGLTREDLLANQPALRARWWSWAEAHIDQPWAMNLQERLLVMMAVQDPAHPLPAYFPRHSARRTPLWGTLRGGLLLAHGQIDQATQQLLLGPIGPERAALLALAHLKRHEPLAAVQTRQLDEASQSYIVRAQLSDVELRSLLGKGAKSLQSTVRIELASREMEAGRFDAAAKLVAPIDPERAALFQQAVALRARGDELALARFLGAHAGQLSHGIDRADLRGLSGHYEPSSPVGKRLAAALCRADERWLALQYYVLWLEAHAQDGQARSVLGEADGLYNKLINWGGAGLFWGQYAPSSRRAARLRRVGALIRRPREPRR